MRFVLAIVSFVLAALMIVFGIAQRTIFAEPNRVELTASLASDAPFTVIDGETLNAFEGNQTLTLSGADQVFAAYGRTKDVIAWIGDASYTELSYDAKKNALAAKVIAGSEEAPPAPNGADLWLEEYTQENNLVTTVSLPEGFSFIIASQGGAPAPSEIAVSWPLDNSTPLVGPLIVGGIILLLLGIGFLIWALSRMRSARGTRRKMPKLPKQRAYRQARPSRFARGRRRMMIAVPLVLTGTFILAGCSSDYWPNFETEPSPSPSAEIPEAAELSPPAVTQRQVERIVGQVSAVATQADANRDGTLLESRFSGAALELRLGNYAIRGADANVVAPPAIPAGPVKLVLPQQTDLWPRTVFAVIQDDKDATIPPVALLLVQETPRSAYLVDYAVTLEPSAVLPDVAPATLGAARFAADTGLLIKTPTDVALGYGDILLQDTQSPQFDSYKAEGDSLRLAVGLAAKEKLRAELPPTAAISFGVELGKSVPIALAANDAGAIVAVNLHELTTVTPTEDKVDVNPEGQVKLLAGFATTKKGIVATYSDQLLFYVPPAGSDGKIVLLGYSQGLISAVEKA